PEQRSMGISSMVRLYADSLYRVDAAYRKLAAAVQSLQNPEWLELAWVRLDNWYTHHFLLELAQWAESTWTPGWFSEDVVRQTEFYEHFLARAVAKTSERIFVVISDALRYEAAVELQERLTRRTAAKTVKITPMQAVLPTYTQLGMASLLPGRTLGMTEQGVVLRDQRSTQGLDNRAAILKAHHPAFDAMNLDDLMTMPVKDGLDRVRGLRVIYLYHNVIDAMGDKATTEGRTFEGVELALQQLEGAVEKLARSYQAARIVITADHGFLYQAQEVAAWNKVEPVSGTVVDGNHRFKLGRDLTAPPGTEPWDLSYLGLTGWEAVIPQGLSRFGGAGGGTRFVHGGPMPQEAVVPVIEYRPIRARYAMGSGPVDVEVVTEERTVTTYAFRVKLFQKQRVSPQRPPRNIQLALYWQGQRISNAPTMVCDATGDVLDRYYDVMLTIHEAAYPPGGQGELRLVDVTEGTASLYLTVPVELRIFAES
ncbi:MAG: BREX-1 system phosphatase PglZ type A, partial [Firmicutes bacterium]|nr:BREX-1 system phosphatase PglZ type A [Bacillota bacterium]